MVKNNRTLFVRLFLCENIIANFNQ